MAFKCERIWADVGDDEDGPSINVTLMPEEIRDDFRHLYFMSRVEQVDRLYVDWGCYVDQSYGEWDWFKDFEISEDRRTLSITTAADYWVLKCDAGIDAECEAVLELMKAGSAFACPEAGCALRIEGGFGMEFKGVGGSFVVLFPDLEPTGRDFGGYDHAVDVTLPAPGGNGFWTAGRPGGVEKLELAPSGGRLEVELNYDVPGMGRSFTVVFEQPVEDRVAVLMRRLGPGRKTAPGLRA